VGPSRANRPINSVMRMTTLLLAALSAVLYGAGVAVEHRQAARTPVEAAGRPWMLALLARQPLWLTGAALEAGGFAMHAAALRSGSLLAVQMILGCSLLVSVSLNSVLGKRPLPRHCWPAIFAIVVSVGLSVALLGPGGHSGDQAPGRAASAALITGLIAAPIAAAGLPATGRRARPLLLAAAAGMADTCVAVLTMAFAHTFAHGLGGVATSWPLYALIVGGLGSLALTQAAYQTDAPLITLPIISALTPLASLGVGILVLHEATHLSSTRSVVGIVCLMLAVTALVVLARAAAALATDDGDSRSHHGSIGSRQPEDAPGPPDAHRVNELCDPYVRHGVPTDLRAETDGAAGVARPPLQESEGDSPSQPGEINLRSYWAWAVEPAEAPLSCRPHEPPWSEVESEPDCGRQCRPV